MKSGIISLLLLAVQASFAQPLTIKEIKHDSGWYSFPVVESTARPDVAKMINAKLQEDWSFNPNSKDPFENVVEQADFGYEVYTNNDKVISMQIEQSYTGCGLHITRQYYLYDVRTGAVIDANKLFGSDGLAKMQKSLFKMWKAKCRAAADNKDDNRADEYRACLVQAETEKQTELGISRMILNDNGIRFWAGGCLEGTAYDFEADVTAGPHDYSLGQLLPMLTPYGYSFFVSNQAGPLRTLLRGTIDGKYPISLTLMPGTDGAIGGMIVYDRVGQPINVNGTLNGNQVVFHELDESNNPLSNIEASWDGTKLTGMFTNLKTKKQMHFAAMVMK